MVWSHFYDLVAKLASLVLSILIICKISFLENNPISLIVTIIAFFLFLYIFCFRTLGSWLYCNINLKMKVSMSQAKDLNYALSILNPLRKEWLSLKEVKSLPVEERFNTAKQLTNEFLAREKRDKKKDFENFKSYSPIHKAGLILFGMLVIGLLIVSELNLPPASYLTELYTNFFETDCYYPMLNWIILVLPLLVIFGGLKKIFRI